MDHPVLVASFRLRSKRAVDGSSAIRLLRFVPCLYRYRYIFLSPPPPLKTSSVIPSISISSLSLSCVSLPLATQCCLLSSLLSPLASSLPRLFIGWLARRDLTGMLCFVNPNPEISNADPRIRKEKDSGTHKMMTLIFLP